jgi:uncharacterized protein YwgA
MDRMKKAAILTKLIQELRKQKSWCGETHIQKTTFFLQELMKVPLSFDFILYKHGPFSFELRDTLTGFRADKLIELELQMPYGPRIVTTAQSIYFQNICSKTLSKYNESISFVAKKIGGKGVAELEKLATALFVTKKEKGSSSIEMRANKVRDYKPHISYDEAKKSVEHVDNIIKDVNGECPTCAEIAEAVI